MTNAGTADKQHNSKDTHTHNTPHMEGDVPALIDAAGGLVSILYIRA